MAILTLKAAAIVLGLATVAFTVSTIVLAVEKGNLQGELDEALTKIEKLESSTTTAPTTGTTNDVTSPSESPGTSDSTPSSGSTEASPSSPESSPGSTEPTTGSTGSTSSPTTPGSGPTFPTLPTGLPNPEEIIYRLPTDLRPIKYNLRWVPNMQEKTFEGEVSIQVEVDVPTNLIVMHSHNLELSGISILNMMARMRVRIRTYYEKKEQQMLFIELEEMLRMNTPYVVSVGFSGSLNGLTGLYASSYFDAESKVERWIATSKFEPTYARQAFPCFDEPAMKAQFLVTVVRPSGDGYHALSNMDVLEENDLGNNQTEVVFSQSVPMSTYLVCFIVSDFASQSRTVNGTLEGSRDFEMRVFSTAAQVNKVEYALNTGVAITEFYIDYFQIQYPLPKLDMAAIPDFVSGAMEHWGLVTYRETALLYDPTISSSANKQRVATVVAHELAHMWFGNLVTMKWWNDLWLNEGFASYIEYKGVNHVHPDWDMLGQFIVSDMHGVMRLDATTASHPIVQTVESPNQITELFDSITYSKGASVIRMLEDLVGAEKFRNATETYLTQFYYGNAETDDFLTELEKQSFEFDVKMIMQTWTEQMGLPVVEVAKNGNTYTLTQKRFLANPEDYNATNTEPSTFNYRWTIPITYFTNTDVNVQRLIFNHNDNQVTFNVLSSVSWIKLNKDQVGYYRVNYARDNWNALTNTLKGNRGAFSNADRAHLLNDAFTLAGAAQLEYAVPLEMSTYLAAELDYLPWTVGLGQLNTIKHLLYYTELYRDFAVYGRSLVDGVYKSTGWTVGNDHLENLLRVDILGSACGFGHAEALNEASSRFVAWLAKPEERPSPDVRSTIYSYGMQAAGNEQRWNQVWQLYLAEQDAQEKIKLMQALAQINEPWILQRFIALAWDESNVRGQDYFSCLTAVSQNRIGQSLVWDHVRENWPALVARFTLNERTLGRLIPSITSRFTTQTKLDEVEAFFAKYPEAGAGAAARKEAIATIKYNIQWLQTNKQQVSDWLATQQTGDTTSTTLAARIQ